MKNTFEKLGSIKFQTLQSKNMMHILGGDTTGKGNFPSTVTLAYDSNGRIIGYNEVTTYWTKDESDGDSMCYYGEYTVKTFIPI